MWQPEQGHLQTALNAEMTRAINNDKSPDEYGAQNDAAVKARLRWPCCGEPVEAALGGLVNVAEQHENRS
jgi:hypothetical protein